MSSKNRDSFDEYIRPPDSVVRERLLGDEIETYETIEDDFDAQMKLALLASAKEYEEQEMAFQELLQLEHQREMMRRKEMFEDLQITMKRVLRFDSAIKELHDILQPIIEQFVEQKIDSIKIDVKTYDFIFSCVSSLRLKNTNCLLYLSNLIKKEE